MIQKNENSGIMSRNIANFITAMFILYVSIHNILLSENFGFLQFKFIFIILTMQYSNYI